ncbi:MAG TPA: proton-conducting transporter membrane subunit, partial [Myxococcaceae bacterium]|nr:proton-conducting transporter membrane subunit [Myxococcaceae bacterium]
MTGAGLFWLGPLLPLVAFGVLALWPGLRGRWLPAGLACVAVAGSLVLSVLGLLGVVLAQARREWAVPFLETGGYRLQWAVELGPQTAVLSALVSAVCLLVFVYTAFQLAEEPRLRRFYALLSLFAASMLGLVVAADVVTLFIAWELVGVCSYLLIGFWHEHEGAPAASSSAFLVTRLGDLALLAGVLLLVLEAGTGRLESLLALI